MKARCYDSRVKAYKWYGGRGISICDEWRGGLAAFTKWALENGYELGLTIERKNVHGNYEFDNCTWIPRADQARNKQATKWITAFGETKQSFEWEKDVRLFVGIGTCLTRIKKGWKPEDAISTPLARKARTAGLMPVADPGILKIKSLVLDSVSSPSSKRTYAAGMDEFLTWSRSVGWQDGFTKAAVNAYKTHLYNSELAPATINLRLTAVKKMAREASDNQLLPLGVADAIERVKGVQIYGRRLGLWLSKQQIEDLMGAPDSNTVVGARDRAMIALMIGSGLRRDELARTTFEQIQQRDGRWILVDVLGKGKKLRSIPIAPFAKHHVDLWAKAAGLPEPPTGRIFKRLRKDGKIIGEKIGPNAVFAAIKKYAEAIGLDDLGPHDLRRSFAKLAHKGKASIEQISLSLGHRNMATTQRYLGIEQDLQDAPCDHLGLKI